MPSLAVNIRLGLRFVHVFCQEIMTRKTTTHTQKTVLMRREKMREKKANYHSLSNKERQFNARNI